MSPASRLVVGLAALGVLATACGDESPAAPSESVVPSLPSRADWCARYAEALDLPAAASPNPDGRELEVLDLHIANAEALAAGAPGVTPAATDAAREVADMYVDVRRRVAGGEQLPDVLTELFSADTNVLFEAARIVEAEAEAIC